MRGALGRSVRYGKSLLKRKVDLSKSINYTADNKLHLLSCWVETKGNSDLDGTQIYLQWLQIDIQGT
mgnify:CR=1 FL=1